MCSRPTRRRGRLAFTLVELMVTMGVSSIVMAAVAAMALYTGRSFAMLANYVDLDNTSRTALDIMTRDVRQVDSVESFSSNSVTFVDSDLQSLSFTYDPSTRTLTRIKRNSTGSEERKELLRECDELNFRMFQRNTVSNSFDLIQSDNVLEGKAIDVSWICSRKILGAKVNTESVQTARIIIRKQQATRY
jgi:prepilin-type N-terminal cleavage/methylation domain-containing protein